MIVASRQLSVGLFGVEVMRKYGSILKFLQQFWSLLHTNICLNGTRRELSHLNLFTNNNDMKLGILHPQVVSFEVQY